MADVTITRGVGFRDDFLAATWMTFNTAHVGVPTLTTDGDIGSLTVIFTSAVSGNNGAIFVSGLSLATNTYPLIMFKGSFGLPANVAAQMIATYSDTSTQTFALISQFLPQTFNLTPGKTLTQINLQFTATGSVASANVVMFIDLCQVFKENLTLPAITQPMPMSVGRIVAVIPILQKEGELLQDLGSKSPELIIQGALVSTTMPTSHTAAEWWDLLEGLILEAANETWQWVSSDRIHYKYLPIDLTRSEILSRKNYYEFTLRLKRFDVLSQTADRLGITY